MMKHLKRYETVINIKYPEEHKDTSNIAYYLFATNDKGLKSVYENLVYLGLKPRVYNTPKDKVELFGGYNLLIVVDNSEVVDDKKLSVMQYIYEKNPIEILRENVHKWKDVFVNEIEDIDQYLDSKKFGL